MNNNRRNFLKLTGLTGMGIVFGANRAESNRPYHKNRNQTFNMHGYAAPKLETVRMGFIGLGDRGWGNVNRFASIEGVDVKALCDIVPHRVHSSIEFLQTHLPHHNPDAYTDGPEAWKQLCERDDIDLICISTPWNQHAEQSIFSMEHDKHVYVDLPVGVTAEECWAVVETSEKTRKHVHMDCVSCHTGTLATLLNMVRHGYFGEILHGEGHYAHDRVSNTEGRWRRDPDNNYWFGFRPWRLQENVNRNGNLYPAHGLGPVSQMMDLNYGDQMDYMVSISSNDFTMADKMREIAEMDEYYKPYVGLEFRGNMNTTIIRTKKGRTLMLQHDISSPGIGQRFDVIRGNKGMYKGNPDRISTIEDGLVQGDEFDAITEQYTPRITKVFNEKRSQATTDFSDAGIYSTVTPEDWRLIDSLRNGLPTEMNVYDAALWSVITPLSEWSVVREGNTVKIPDFTAGAWKTNKRGMDVSLREGGTTNLL